MKGIIMSEEKIVLEETSPLSRLFAAAKKTPPVYYLLAASLCVGTAGFISASRLDKRLQEEFGPSSNNYRQD
jgi:hypothetical protein